MSGAHFPPYMTFSRGICGRLVRKRLVSSGESGKNDKCVDKNSELEKNSSSLSVTICWFKNDSSEILRVGNIW